MARHNELGKWGERLATDYLISNGYAIIGQNVKIGSYEIDIIVSKDDRIAFVEVKTRSTDVGDPVDAVDEKRVRRMARAADSYLRSKQIKAEPQFDVITIVGEVGGEFKLVHYPDAFFPPLDCL